MPEIVDYLGINWVRLNWKKLGQSDPPDGNAVRSLLRQWMLDVRLDVSGYDRMAHMEFLGESVVRTDCKVIIVLESALSSRFWKATDKPDRLKIADLHARIIEPRSQYAVVKVRIGAKGAGTNHSNYYSLAYHLDEHNSVHWVTVLDANDGKEATVHPHLLGRGEIETLFAPPQAGHSFGTAEIHWFITHHTPQLAMSSDALAAANPQPFDFIPDPLYDDVGADWDPVSWYQNKMRGE